MSGPSTDSRRVRLLPPSIITNITILNIIIPGWHLHFYIAPALANKGMLLETNHPVEPDQPPGPFRQLPIVPVPSPFLLLPTGPWFPERRRGRGLPGGAGAGPGGPLAVPVLPHRVSHPHPSCWG